MFSARHKAQVVAVNEMLIFSINHVEKLFEMIATRECQATFGTQSQLKLLKSNYFNYLRGILTDQPIEAVRKRILLTQLRNISSQKLFDKYLSCTILDAIIADTEADCKQLKTMFSEDLSSDDFLETITTYLNNSNTASRHIQILPDILQAGSDEFNFQKTAPVDEHTSKVRSIRQAATDFLANNQTQLAIDKYKEGLDVIKLFPSVKMIDRDNEHEILIGLMAALNNKAILLTEQKKNNDALQCYLEAVNLIGRLPFLANDNQGKILNESKNNLLMTGHACAIEYHDNKEYCSAFNRFADCIRWSIDLMLHETEMANTIKNDFTSYALKSAHLMGNCHTREILWNEVIYVASQKPEDLCNEEEKNLYLSARREHAASKFERAKHFANDNDIMGSIEKFLEIFTIYKMSPKNISEQERNLIEKTSSEISAITSNFIANGATVNNLIEFITLFDRQLIGEKDKLITMCYRFVLALCHTNYATLWHKSGYCDAAIEHIEKALEHWNVINPSLPDDDFMKDFPVLHQNAMTIYIQKNYTMRLLEGVEPGYSLAKIQYLEKATINYCSIQEDKRTGDDKLALNKLKDEAEFVMQAAIRELNTELMGITDSFSFQGLKFFHGNTSYTYGISHEYLQLITFHLRPLLKSVSKVNAEYTMNVINAFIEDNQSWPTNPTLKNLVEKLNNLITARNTLTIIKNNILPIENSVNVTSITNTTRVEAAPAVSRKRQRAKQ